MNDYQKQANDFLKEIGAKISVTFSHTGNMDFDEKSTFRDIYNVVLSRKGKEYSFKFGQSITNSGRLEIYQQVSGRGNDRKIGFMHEGRTGAYPIENNGLKSTSAEILKSTKITIKPMTSNRYGTYAIENKNFSAPSAYDILACLTKVDPWTFENFCSNYGYNEDSIKARDTYFAVEKEYKNVYSLFHDVMNQLEEIN